jgi:hypothetical protein
MSKSADATSRLPSEPCRFGEKQVTMEKQAQEETFEGS